MYTVILDGEVISRNVPARHIDSIVYDLAAQGIMTMDEYWDEDGRTVNLTSDATEGAT